MRRYLVLILAMSSILTAGIFGIMKRQTYTDLTKQEDYLMQLQVAELSEGFVEVQCADMQQNLPEAAYIIKVQVTEEIEHLFRVDRQKAVIKEIYVGSGLEQGEEVYIFSDHWKLILDGNPDSISRGFVNIMDVGAEYLVFAEDVVESPWSYALAVKLCDSFFIAPIFCYDERQNVAMPVQSDITYVPYQDVRYNEFFGVSEKTLKTMEELKKQMLSLYPADNF